MVSGRNFPIRSFAQLFFLKSCHHTKNSNLDYQTVLNNVKSALYLSTLFVYFTGCNARNLRHRQRHGDGGDSSFPREEVQRPIFQEMPHNITVGPGDRAVLRCRVEHLGTKKVMSLMYSGFSWNKDNIGITWDVQPNCLSLI